MWTRHATLWPVLLVAIALWSCSGGCEGHSLRSRLLRRAATHRIQARPGAFARNARGDGPDGNPCPEAEKPFPCKSTPTCIPMGYLCDYNIDCEDGYDEDPDVCTAAHRPPVVDILNFLESTKSWIMDKLFAGKDITDVAHALAVSPTVADFQRRLGLSSDDVVNLKVALRAVAEGDEGVLASLGMPPSDWNEMSFMFAKLIKSGFIA